MTRRSACVPQAPRNPTLNEAVAPARVANVTARLSTDSSTTNALTPPSDSFDDDMENATNAVSIGALRKIVEGEDVQNPVLQCVQIKPMQTAQNGQERWRIVFNDTINFIQGMMAMQSNHLINDGKLKKGSLCRLTQFQANFVKDKHILIVIDLDVLEEYGEQDKLGQPVALEGGAPKQEQQESVKPQPGNISSNNFYGQKPPQQMQQQQQQQPQRSLPSRSNGASNSGSHGMITPIEAISPYSHKWTIKARCTNKSDIKTWHNKNGEGKLFSATFLDESGEIRATGFNDAVDSFYELLQENAVYYISTPCRVQMAKKQFSNVNNDYELTFENGTSVEKAEDNEGVPQVRYNFTTISGLQGIEKDATVDIIGVLQEVGETNEITSKTTGKPYSKRELTLVDDTGYNVRLTVWGKTAESFDSQPESVVAFKGVKVSDFGGRSLSLLSSGTMTVDPDIEEAYKLKGWYDGAGRSEQFQSHANTMSTVGATAGGRANDTKTVAQVRDENLGMGTETDWFSLKATIVYIKQDTFSYPACRTKEPACNKKVTEVDENQWRCEKCEVTWDKPEHRYIMSVNVTDHTGQIWLSCFNETGERIMGMPANDLFALKEEGDEKHANEAFDNANCRTYIFRCKAKMDSFQDQQRVRYQVQSCNAIDFSREARKLADIIKLYNIADNNSLFVN